jgi:DNA-binding transcriptional ArsR family regulator
MTDYEIGEITKIFKALSDPTRFKIFLLLNSRIFCVNGIVNFLQISQPAVSQHLKILREAGLVKIEKKGYWVHYSSNKEKIDKFLKDFPATLKLKGVRNMGKEVNKKECKYPERLKGKTEECTPEQIKKCHSDISIQKHPCVSKKN